MFRCVARGLFHEAADLLSGSVLHLVGDMGVGIQCEACGVVTQHTGQGLHVHTALHGHSSEGMSEVVKSHAGINARSLQEQLVDAGHPVGTPVISRLG